MNANNKDEDKVVIKVPSHITISKSKVTTPAWPYITIGLVLIAFTFLYLIISKPALTDDKIKEQSNSIESISKSTFDNIKSTYKFEERNGVFIDYSYDKDTIRVEDEYFLQDFLVNDTVSLSEEELDEEISYINSVYSFIDEEKTRAAHRAILYLLTPLFFFMVFYGLIINGINKQNIRKLESLAEAYNQ